MSEQPESELVQKGYPHDACGSSDGVALYSDGHSYCFACATYIPGDGEPPSRRPQAKSSNMEAQELLEGGSHRAIKTRGLSQETCRKWDYRVRKNARDEFEQLAPYRDKDGSLVGVKVRPPSKDDMWWAGSAKGNLWGRHMWAGGGLKLTIVEGEIDAMTVSQAYGHKYPVVSVPNGAAEAAKAVAKNLEWVSSFGEVILGFDMDEPGQAAAKACAALLPPGKVKIVKWSRKDANEMLTEGEGDKITLCIYQAEPYRPDGIVDARLLTAQCLDPVVTGIPWPWPFMTGWTYGRRHRELYTWGGGTGIGKTDILAEIIACTIKGEDKAGEKFTPESCAIFGYESGPAALKKMVAGKLWGRRFHIPQDDSGQSWTEDELRAAMDYMDQDLWGRGGKLFINDSFGAADWALVVERARYLRHAENVRHFVIDPISALVAGLEDERKALDKLVLEGSALANELEACVYFASHLTRPGDGPSHEEGGHVRLNQFRGSNGIGMFSHFVFGAERDQQAESAADRCVTTFRVVKDRYTGNSTGKTERVIYDVLHGTLDLMAPMEFDAPDSIPPLSETE